MKALLTTIAFALILGGGSTFLWMYYGGFESEGSEAILFIDTYGEYAETAEAVEMLVNVPGTENNTARAELLNLLESILTKEMTPKKRDTLARLAYKNLTILEKEANAAQSAQAKLYEELQKLDTAAKQFHSIDLQKRANEVVRLARKRAELSARITAILSETNEQTHAIITRILAEKGVLTQAHIIEINDTTVEAQSRFDTLENLYTQLLEKKNEAEIAFSAFVQVAI